VPGVRPVPDPDLGALLVGQPAPGDPSERRVGVARVAPVGDRPAVAVDVVPLPGRPTGLPSLLALTRWEGVIGVFLASRRAAFRSASASIGLKR
jgi:hypothetical protein